MRFAMIAALMLLTSPARSAEIQYPTQIPAECFELAQRENFPTVIENKAQGLRAKFKLYRMSKSDPLVKQCRDAVAQATR